MRLEKTYVQERQGTRTKPNFFHSSFLLDIILECALQSHQMLGWRQLRSFYLFFLFFSFLIPLSPSLFFLALQLHRDQMQMKKPNRLILSKLPEQWLDGRLFNWSPRTFILSEHLVKLVLSVIWFCSSFWLYCSNQQKRHYNNEGFECYFPIIT